MTSKADFIRSLQSEIKGLSPYDISQRLRLECGCVSIYHGDDELSVEDFRGYMVKFTDKPNRSPNDPELYVCVISLQQSKAWQDVVWIKEILQILDRIDQRTDDPAKLRSMLANRAVATPNGTGTPGHVVADKNGLTLALGSAIPRGYRKVLRDQNYLDRYDVDELEHMLLIPAEWVEFLLDESFEPVFEEALASCS